MKPFLSLSIALLCLTYLSAQDCSQFILDATLTDVSCFGRSDGQIDLTTPCSASGGSTSNLALNQPSIQSSTQGEAVAARANDGNTDGQWWETYSVAGTNWSSQPYWEVDLGAVYEIEEVEVWGRTDCCSSFLSDYYVLVSDAPFSSANLNTVLNQAGVTSVFHSGVGGTPEIESIGTTGQYVRIQMQGAHLLQLAEVIVTGGATNNCEVDIAWDNGLGNIEDLSDLSAGTYNVTVSNTEGCTATGTYIIAEPTLLTANIIENTNTLDAVTNGGTAPYTYDWNTGETTSTLTFSASGTYNITITDANNCIATASITTDCVTGGTCDDGDDCTINDVFDSNCDCIGTFQDSDDDGVCDADDLCPGFDDSIDTNNNGIPDDCDSANCNIFTISGTSQDVSCGGASDGRIDLTLPCTPSGGETNLALNQVSIQSSTSGEAEASRANDGNTDGNWYTGNSVSGTNWQFQPYWEVDLGSSQPISDIEIWGRTDCCSSFLSDYYVLVSETPFSSTSLNGALSQTGVTSVFHEGVGGTPETEIINVTGRYVRIQLEGAHLLQLAEVIIHGGGDSACDLTIDWDNGLGNVQNPSGLSAGTYSVTVSSAEGCIDTETFIIQEPTPMICQIEDDDDNELEASVTGGASPYTYLWSNGTSGSELIYTIGGTYSVTITDANGCSCSNDFITDCVEDSACDDGDDCTINDTFDDNCDCVGTFVDSDNDGVCDEDDICPGFDDHIDDNNNGIPDGCEGSGDLSLSCPSDIIVNASSPNGAIVSWNLPNITSTCTVGGGGNCPSAVDNYNYLGEYGGHKYFVSTSSNTWAYGKQSSINAGGQLVIIETEAENLFLKDAIPTAVFIGLTDEEVEGTYKWVDGTPLGSYNNIGNYAPNTDSRDYGILNTWLGGQWSHQTGQAYKKHLLEFTCENGPVLTQTAGVPSGNLFAIGTHTISYEATDPCGNVVVCSFNITVEPPSSDISITCPNNITTLQTNPGGAVVTWNNPSVNTTCEDGLESITQISGISNGQTFPVGTTTVSYQATDKCGSSISCSFTVTVEADTSGELPEGYCSSKGEQPWWQWIQVVDFGSIHHGSIKAPYNDFTDINTEVTLGGTYPISIEPAFSWMAFEEYFSVWIDYNRDGDLDDPGELAFQAFGTSEVSGAITIPADAAEGVTLIRIAMKNGAYADPCETFLLGEVEDYSVTITNGTVPFAIAETDEVLTFEVQQAYQEAQLYWVNNTGAENDRFVIERSTNGTDFSPIAEMDAWAEESRTRYHNIKDKNPLVGDNFYRLALYYLDGRIEYSKIRSLHFARLLDFNVFPNPVKSEEVYLDLRNIQDKNATITVYNQFGNAVLQENIETVDKTVHALDISTLQNGLYMIFIQAAGRRSVGKKLVVTKLY